MRRKGKVFAELSDLLQVQLCMRDMKRYAKFHNDGKISPLIPSQTSGAILNFFLLMVLNPEAQRRAQEEIDRVIGHLPVQEDAKDVPYLQAVIQELHRLHVLSPMAAPHAATKDVEVGLFP